MQLWQWKKGMHVFIEKPVCLTREDADLLLRKEKETGVKVMVGQVVRCFAEYEFLKKAYEAGTYGKLESIVMKRISGDVQWGYEDWFHHLHGTCGIPFLPTAWRLS